MANATVRGLKELQNAFNLAGSSAPRLAHRALREEAEEAFILTQQVVPVEFGELRSSGTVSSQLEGTKATAEIKYGGGAVSYAVFVHEIPPSRAKHASPTSWKYVERPVKLYAKGMGARMAARVFDMIHREFR